MSGQQQPPQPPQSPVSILLRDLHQPASLRLTLLKFFARTLEDM